MDLTLQAALWLALVAVLVALFWVILRRTAQLAALTRGVRRVQKGVRSGDEAFGARIEPLAGLLDALRRRAGDEAATEAAVAGAHAAVLAAAADLRTSRPPAALAGTVETMAAELDRTARALDLLDHGLARLRGAWGPEEQEAQSALKRGLLALRHARTSWEEVAGPVRRLRPVELLAPHDRRSRERGRRLLREIVVEERHRRS